jgi:hypothetical protein
MFDKIRRGFNKVEYYLGEVWSSMPQMICIGGGVILMIIGTRSRSGIANPIEWIGLVLTSTGTLSLIFYWSGYSQIYKDLDVSDAVAIDRISKIKDKGGYCTKYGNDHHTLCAPSAASLNGDSMNASGKTKDQRLYDTRCYPKNFDTMDRNELMKLHHQYNCSKQAINYELFLIDNKTTSQTEQNTTDSINTAV